MAEITTLAAVCNALATGLAVVTGFSSAAVSDKDWQIANHAASLFVYPSGSGAQELTVSGSAVNVFHVRYDVTIELWEKNTGNVQRLYTDTQAHIDGVLAWLRANDNLGDTSGLFATCNAGAVRWQTQDVRDEAGGLGYRLTTFTVPCLLVGLT